MLFATSRFALVAFGLSLAGACSSATVPDAGSPDAAAASRPDAIVNADARAAISDTGVESDAGFPDADVVPDDAGPVDSGPVGPCGPLDKAQGPARFTAALASWVDRCNPELTPNEVLSISGFISFVAAPAFENVTLTYDATAAGQCGCAIADAPCDSLAWFRAIDACDATFVSTATTGDACSTDFDCPTRHRCAESQKDVAFVGLLPPTLCGQGVCQQFVALGEPCSDSVECAPGTYCNSDAVPEVCAANAALGEDCTNRPCVGDSEQVLILPPNQCSFTKGPATCMARGRAGGNCEMVACQELYRCDNNLDCQPMPGEGDACVTVFELNPSIIARELQMHESRFACRGNLGVGLGASTYCVPTSTTTGDAVCRTHPVIGQPCGIGADLSPFCAPDAFCRDVDPLTLAPVTSLCIPRRTETSTCGGRPLTTFAPNQECEPGTTCTFEVGTGMSRCLDTCGGV